MQSVNGKFAFRSVCMKYYNGHSAATADRPPPPLNYTLFLYGGHFVIVSFAQYQILLIQICININM
jgi:hypothetical protein